MQNGQHNNIWLQFPDEETPLGWEIDFPAPALLDEDSSPEPSLLLPTPFFTGREDWLERIREAMGVAGKVVVSGLGGIGKTQLALEYLHRHRQEYAHIFWVQAEDEASLRTGFREIAGQLALPSADGDPEAVLQEVKRWLVWHDRWLLVLDGADDPELLKAFLPPSWAGHLLVTSRATAFPVLGIEQSYEIEPFSTEEGAHFVMARTGLEGQTAESWQAARALACELEGLPLALEQAGAEMTALQVSPQEYLQAFRRHGLQVLECSRPAAGGYAATVATTWARHFAEIERTPSHLIMSFCAVLAPAPYEIPLALLQHGLHHLLVDGRMAEVYSELPDLDRLLQPLLDCSLLRRNAAGDAVSVYRLVQEVFRSRLPVGEGAHWSELAANLLTGMFPAPESGQQAECARLYPHLLAVADAVGESPLTWQLLMQATDFLRESRRIVEADPLLHRALALAERFFPAGHWAVVGSLTSLAEVRADLGDYPLAEKLLQRVLRLLENHPETDCYDAGTVMNNLALLYLEQNRLAEAHPLLTRALALRERAHGSDHLAITSLLQNLAEVHRRREEYTEAERLLLRTLAIRQHHLGEGHIQVAATLNTLAALYSQRGNLEAAEAHFQRALAIREQQLGEEHPAVAASVNNLAVVYRERHKYLEAEQLFLQAMTITRKILGPHHPLVANVFEEYALLLDATRRPHLAEKLRLQAARIREALGAQGVMHAVPPPHPMTAPMG